MAEKEWYKMKSGQSKTNVEVLSGDEGIASAKRQPSEKKEVELAFGDAVQVNGLYAIFAHGSPLLRKSFWMIIVLVGVGVAIVQIFQQLAAFYTYPTVTKVALNTNSGIIFPRVTICNQNRLRSLFVSATATSNATSLTEYLEQESNATDYSLDWATIYRSFAHDLDTMLLKCSFGNKSCSAADFTGVFTDVGYCYTFNSDVDDPLVVNYPGKSHGLTVLLDAQTSQYLHSTEYTGFVVMLHDQSDPYADVHHTVSVGAYTTFSIRKNSINHMKPPYGSCGSLELETFDVYTQKACKLECSIMHIQDQCNCTQPFMGISNTTTCSPQQDEECVPQATFDYDAAGSPCRWSCPSDCRYVFYSHEMTFTSFSDSRYEKMTQEYGGNATYWSQNAVMINVHYGHLMEFTVEPSAVYTSGSLLCDIGGALGLILGASIINVLQLVDFSLMWMIYKRGRKSDTSQSDATPT